MQRLVDWFALTLMDNGYRQTPPEDGKEWAQFWKLLEEWQEVRGAAHDALAVIHALATIKRALPYIIGIAAVILALMNKEMLAGFFQ